MDILNIIKRNDVKHSGKHIIDNGQPEVRFVSYHKNPVFIRTTDTENVIIQFQRGVYITNDPDDIAFLKSSDAFNKYIFENQFSDEILRKIEEDKRYTTRQSEYFINIEEYI